MGELGRCLSDVGPERKDKVGPLNAFKRFANSAKVDQITDEKLGAKRFEFPRACVFAVNERTNGKALIEQFFCRGAAGRSRSAGDQYGGFYKMRR